MAGPSARRQPPHPLAIGLCALTWVVVVESLSSWPVLALMCAGAVGLQWRDGGGNSRPGRAAAGWALPFLLLYVAIGSLFGTVSETVWWRGPHLPGLGTLVLGPESLEAALVRGLRLWNLLVFLSWFGQVVRPDDITHWLGRRFARAGLTVQMVIGFVPQLLRERERVEALLRLRAGNPTGGIRMRVRHLAVVYQTLLMNGLERAWTLAESMYTRGYGGPGRTQYRPPRWRRQDSGVAAGCALALALAVWSGLGRASGWEQGLAAAIPVVAGAWMGGRRVA
ncbi:energy-coupling factor transporter transmembrane component T [Alicyclobacillus sp.]|uniref:energy-coupling factor transporter transmembrane component T n=1 Tax=Alicyclobacillus sp. TaxID=61169 RepID=UPI0025C4E608|nr:energy-coupling factor transporter transmembrane component T [Alicyclobacillus sp.]MCL6516270.1 energy-coupling factor transporter transmembrane protein EcfT [Alicyclobacillus sp.]